MDNRSVGIAPDNDAAMTKPADNASALVKLQAHFDGLDEAALLRVARAVELARAAEKRDPSDEQILMTLRPRLRKLRPERVLTFQRAVCRGVETFLYDGEPVEEKRQGAIPRQVLRPWWRILHASSHHSILVGLEADYSRAVQEQRWKDLLDIADRGALAAGDATLALLAEAGRTPGRRAELASAIGGERLLEDLREIGILLRLHPLLTPALDRVRRVAGVAPGDQIFEFTPSAVVAARTAYLNLHDIGSEVVGYFFLGLMALLMQPFQALRLVRVLSQDMSGAANSPARLIPARLFSDLTRTLSDIGRAQTDVPAGGRRVWLLTCARLVTDAGAMIQGLSDEIPHETDPEWQKLLVEARTRILSSVDTFLNAAMADCLRMLPVREAQDRKGGEIRLEPDMTHTPGEEEIGIAQAGALLFSAVTKLMEQEGHERALRPKVSDLEHKLEMGIKFRVEYLRARLKHGVALAQLSGILNVLRGLPPLNIIRDLEYRVERTLERHR